MQIAPTSLAAFHSLPVAGYLQPKEQAVLSVLIGRSSPLTREQLAHVLGWKESAVCGRVNSLVAKGMLEEIPGGKTSSGRSAMLVRAPDAQKDLF